ncbi:MAG: single-stranded DNA-binding protein [Calditrichaeota bacterium]|nr:single-stranded DNA-binding protein [Calditrichota bacterium]
MSRGINKVILIGHLGRDPELTYTPSGMAVARFSLATSEGRRKNENEWEEVTHWHRIVLYGKNAETAGQYLAKGKQVYIEGSIRYGSYEKDGVKHYTTDIIGNRMQLLGRKEDGGREGEEPYYEPTSRTAASPAPPPEPEVEDDIPF